MTAQTDKTSASQGHGPRTRPGFWTWLLLNGFPVAVIVVLPIAYAGYQSFRGDGGLTLRACAQVLAETRQWGLLRNSLAIGLGSACGATVLGFAAAFAVAYLRVPTRRALTCGLALPFLVPPYVAAIAWIEILGTNGLVHKALQHAAIDLTPPSISSATGVIFVYSLAYCPIAALFTGLALGRFDRRLEEAATLSVSRTQAFCTVLLPLLMPSVVTGALIVFLLSLVGFAVPSLLQVNVYPVEVFTSFSAFYDFSTATAQAAPLLAAGAAAVLLCSFYIVPRRAWLTGSSRTHTATRGTPILRAVAAAACWGLVAAASLMPLGVLVWRSLPLSSYSEVFVTSKDEILLSVVVAAGTATLVTALALSLSLVRRFRAPTRRTTDALGTAVLLAPFLLSGPVIGIALIGVWNRPGIAGMVYDSVLILVLATSARFLFFAQRGFRAALAEIHPRIQEAAFVAGIPWTRQATAVLFPLVSPVALAVWGLTFIFAMGELDAAALVCPPGATTLPIHLFSAHALRSQQSHRRVERGHGGRHFRMRRRYLQPSS